MKEFMLDFVEKVIDDDGVEDQAKHFY